METIIKKATSQGYALNKDEIRFALTTRMVCDPLFWQALGKSAGWDKGIETCIDESCPEHSTWKQNALRFHEINLTEGWDSAIKYLSEILK